MSGGMSGGTRYRDCTRRLLILALDGASPELIERWASEGRLPHLRRLMEEGAFGPLESVIPPVTGAAWGSFLTGLSPGRHGVCEWLRRRPHSYALEPVDGSALPSPTLLEWLSAHGQRVGVVSLPLTYPFRFRDRGGGGGGFAVGDLLTPPGRPYTHPPSLQRELEEALGGRYPLAPPPWPGGRRAAGWFSRLQRSLELRARAILYLAARKDWDVFLAHVMETDSVQHQMWHTLDRHPRPRYGSPLPDEEPVLEVYRRADALVGELRSLLDERDTLWVISDHGFGPHRYNLHLNTWLLRQGFLRLRGNLPTRVKRALYELGVVPENLYPWEARLGLLGRGSGDPAQAYRWLSRFALSTANVDWSRTVAYSYGNVGQIFLNRRGREPQGIVPPRCAPKILEEVEEALREWRNPWTGEPVVERLFRAEELYGPERHPQSPDLVFLPAEGHSPMGLSEFLSNRPVTHAVAHSGWHRLYGVFLGCGAGLPRGRVRLRLLDLFPTICELLGVPPPPGLDGRASEALRARHPVGSASTSETLDGGRTAAQDQGPGDFGADAEEGLSALEGSRSGSEGSPLSPEEEEEIRERLRGLGYL